jgi:hypothetical protein
MKINGYDQHVRPYFYVSDLNIHAVPMEDAEGLYYNVSIGNGNDRQDFFVLTPLEAYKLVKNLMK